MLYGTKADKSKAITYDKEELDVKFENVTPDLPDIDDTPTTNSNNPVKSGGVKAADDAIRNDLRPRYAYKSGSDVLVKSSETNKIIISNMALPTQGNTHSPVYLVIFSGNASFDDGGAIPQEGEGLYFDLSDSRYVNYSYGANWGLKATNIGFEGYFNFVMMMSWDPANREACVKVTNWTQEDVYLTNLKLTIIAL